MMDATPALVAQSEDLLRITSAGADERADVLAAAKAVLAAVDADLEARFLEGMPALKAMAERSNAMDTVIKALLGHAAEKVFPAANPTTGERFAVIAVGGYGRGNLAPYSDIDLLFLTPYKRASRVEQMVEHMLYLLWDLGLKVGHATRSIEECVRLAKSDMMIRTSLLEARLIWGEAPLADELRDVFWSDIASDDAQFMSAKLEEREKRHASFGDSRYMLEPNVKEGKGGLRDIHALYWIAKHHYQVEKLSDLVALGVLNQGERRRFRKASEFLTAVRCHLHHWAGRAEERLTFDAQVTIAERMGYQDRPHVRGVERFMKHYYLTAKTVGDLTRIICAALEAAQNKSDRFSLSRLLKLQRDIEGYEVISGRIAPKDSNAFRDDPVEMLRIFHVAEKLDLDIHPGALRLIRRDLKKVDSVRDDPEANRLFLEILESNKTPARALGRMNEAAVLGRFVPDFGRIVAQMQYDMYHTYTVDEHTIRVIGMLSALEKGSLKDVAPVASSVVGQTASRRALFVALFLHDIAKGRGGDHSVLGAEVAEYLGPRFGLDPSETETVVWLVRNHLVMSHIAFKRDPADPQTVRDFVGIVQSLERLRLLLVLTICDIRGVGPNTWTEWKASLLRELYFRAQEAIAGGDQAKSVNGRTEAAREATEAEMRGWDAEVREAVLAQPSPSFWLSAPPDELARRLDVYAQAKASNPQLIIAVRPSPEGDASEVVVALPDHPGIFARIAGGLAVAGVDIVQSQAATLADGFVLDVFIVAGDAEDDGAEQREARIQRSVRAALSGEISLSEAFNKTVPWRRRSEVFSVPPQVVIDNKASRTHTVIEVVGRNRPGFLNKIAWTLTQQGLQIAQSRISTYGERAVDVFYVKDVFGLKMEQETKIRNVRKALLQALREMAETGEP
jgi:[protein-PII] uridylyltransferase